MKYYSFLLMTYLLCCVSCKKSDAVVDPPPPGGGGSTDTATTLKSASSIPIGLAIDYALFKNNASYKNTVIREADQVTFGYHMKHGAIVKDDGSFDYSTADELFNLSTAVAICAGVSGVPVVASKIFILSIVYVPAAGKFNRSIGDASAAVNVQE